MQQAANSIMPFLYYPISITSIFITLQHSLPLSLGLLGALSIVRFRTPIKEPEEIGFLMLIIATSLICATANHKLLLVTLLITILGLLFVNKNTFLQFFIKKNQENGLFVIYFKDKGNNNLIDIIHLLKSNLSGKVENLIEKENTLTISYRFFQDKMESLEKAKKLIQKQCKTVSFQTYLS